MLKKFFNAFFVLILSGISVSMAQKSSCCSKPANPTEAFAMLGDQSSFQSAHQSPLPFSFQAEKGKMIDFKTEDGGKGSAFEVKSATPTKNVVFMIHEWWGLNDHIKQEAEKLQKELGNVNVIALDLYDKQLATHAEQAGKLMGEVKTDRASSIIKGAIEYVGKDAKIYTIGWCFGGGWSLQSSILANNQASGCVMYYGMPEKDIAKLKTLNAEVLFIFASKDQWINQEVVNSFEKDMRTAGKKLSIKTYDADHAFANPSNPKHNKEFADDAHKQVLAFFKNKMN